MEQLSPIGWAVRPLKRYADFSGRAPRAEYWWFILFQVILLWIPLMVVLLLGLGFAGETASQGNPHALTFFGAGFWAPTAIVLVAMLALIIPALAVQVRRLHDQNLSGWFILLFFIPYIGGIVGIVFMCIPGTKGPNRFGSDPYEIEDGYLEQVFA